LALHGKISIYVKCRRGTNINSDLYRGLYNGKSPGGGGKYQPMSFGGKNMKRTREKGGKCGRKGKKGERKLEKRKQKGKINAK
jgi:hypothetical protein